MEREKLVKLARSFMLLATNYRQEVQGFLELLRESDPKLYEKLRGYLIEGLILLLEGLILKKIEKSLPSNNTPDS